MLNKIIAATLAFLIIIVFVLPILSWKMQSHRIEKEEKKKLREESGKAENKGEGG
ncbi:hypothetical protein KJ885_04500 [Patescibacteria group bacterium]|nr:hypothetical protein [Patescibacteria group bacterium]